MRTLVESALHFRVIVVVVSILLMVWGILSFREAPQDVFPEFAPPRVEIQTEARGLSTVEVEELVTTPLEQALTGLPWVTEVRSKSVLGLSSVVLHLERGSDVLVARQLVAERVGVVARQLPGAVTPPVILPPLSSTSRLMKIGMRSDTLDIASLTDAAMITLRPRLMAIQGVANVAVWGARPRELQVRIDPDQLALAGVTLAEVQQATAKAVSTRTGGFVDTPNQRMAVFHTSPIEGAPDLAEAPLVTNDGRILRLGDVADVVASHPIPIGDAVIDGGEGLLLIVEKQPWGNTLQVTHAVEQELARLAPSLPGVELDPTIFRPASFVETALENLGHALWVGIVLVVAVLVLFEPDPRSALISATAIPLSIAIAVLVLSAMGVTFDTMVLAGLIIAVGEVVDDAIIDVENIARRLRESDGTRSTFTVILDASMEVRSAVVYASVIVVLVFLPVFFLPGVSGAFFRPLAQAYIIAITASLFVALTVTPALCSWWLPGSSERGPRLATRWTLRAYRRVLPSALAHPRCIAAGLAMTLVVAFASAPFLGESFLPDFRERDFLMHWVEQPGTSLSAMRRITERVGNELIAVPGVRNFGAHIGRAEAADEVVGPNFTELWVNIDEGADHDATLARIQAVVDGYPGLYRDVQTYLKERIKEVLSGTSATLAVRIYGPELDGLKEAAATVHDALREVPGIVAPRVEVQALVPQLQIALRPEAAGVHGLSTQDLRDAVTPMLAGVRAGGIQQSQRTIDVVVIGTDALRADPSAVAALWVDTPTGARVRLADVADVWVAPAPNVIHHEGGFRRIDVLADAAADLGSVSRGVEEALASVTLPPGYHAEVLGEYQERANATRALQGLALAALFAVFLVLHADFGSLGLSALVYATLPFALIGGIGAVWLTGGVLSLGSVVGFVTVLGIATRNGILLVSHFRHLEVEAAGSTLTTIVSRAAEERLVPILMTASSAGLALIPIVWTGPVAGHEIEHPMAVVILGGLATSTALNLLCLPSLYLAYRSRFGPSIPPHTSEASSASPTLAP